MAYACGRRAGQRALARSANREAADHFAAALDAFRRLDRDLRKPRREFDIRLDLAQACFLMSREAGVRAHLGRARGLAKAGLDERRCIRVLSLTGLYFWYSGDMSRAVSAAELALRQASNRRDVELELPCLFRLGGFLVDRGDYSSASGHFGKAVERIPEEARFKRLGLLGILSTGCFATWARGLAELGQFAEAERAADQAVYFAEEAGHTFSQVYGRLLTGYVLLRRGEFEQAFPILEESLEICRVKRLKSVYGLNAIAFAYACVRSGRGDRGLEVLQSEMDDLRTQTLILRPSLQFTWVGETYLLTGHLEMAKSWAAEAFALALKHGECGHEAWALWLLGSIALSRPGAAEAESCFLRAAEIAAARDMTPLSAHCRVGLARHLSARGERNAALAEWRSASATYRELGMTGWLARAHQDLRDLTEQPEVVTVG